jgi:hypothetical protein
VITPFCNSKKGGHGPNRDSASRNVKRCQERQHLVRTHSHLPPPTASSGGPPAHLPEEQPSPRSPASAGCAGMTKSFANINDSCSRLFRSLMALSAARSPGCSPMSRLLGLAVGFGFGFGFGSGFGSGFGLGCWVRLLPSTTRQTQTPDKPSAVLSSLSHPVVVVAGGGTVFPCFPPVHPSSNRSPLVARMGVDGRIS